MKIAVQMDHINSINIVNDTTFVLCLEAQRRRHTIFHYTPDRLSLLEGKVFARLERLKVYDEASIDRHFWLGSSVETNLAEMDVILLRQDPPFDMAYITTTHLLERIHPKTLVVNNPTWVRNSPEKIFVTEFPDLMPATLITKDENAIADFRHTFGDIILKPLYGNGGIGIFYISRNDSNFCSLIEMFKRIFREPFIIQKYLSSVKYGDKRIILINGQPVGAINRIPAKGEVRSNIHVGGKAEKTKLNEREIEICDRIGPALKSKGIILAGLDIIGNFITEINITSPTGLREIKHFDGIDLAELFWDTVEENR